MNQHAVDKIALASMAATDPPHFDFHMGDWVRHRCERYVRQVSHVDSSPGDASARLYFSGVYGESRFSRHFVPVKWRVGEIYHTTDDRVTARIERIIPHAPPPENSPEDTAVNHLRTRRIILAALHGAPFFGHVRAFDSRTGKNIDVDSSLIPHGGEQNPHIRQAARSLKLTPFESFQSRNRLPISPEWLLAIGGKPLLSGEILFESTGRDGPGYHSSEVWQVSCNTTNTLDHWKATVPHGHKTIRLPTPEDRGEAINVLRAFRFIPTE